MPSIGRRERLPPRVAEGENAVERLPEVPDAAGRRKALAAICLALVLTMSTWFSATAVAPELAALWRLSQTEASVLTIAVQGGFVAGALLLGVGNLPDIVPVRPLMHAAALIAAAANALPLIVPEFGAAVAARFVTGMCLAGLYPPALKLLATWFTTGRGFALGSAIAALTLGSALPHLLRATVETDWRLVVAATSAATLLGAAVLFLAVHEGPHPFPAANFDPKQIGRVLRNRAVVLASLGYFGHMWELYAMWAWIFAFTTSAFALQAVALAPSLVTFLAIGAGAIGCVAGGLVADRVGRTVTTSGMMLVSATCALVIGAVFDGPLWAFVLIVAVWGASIVGDSAQFSAIVTEAGERDLVGTALTLQLGVGFALTIAAIWLIPAMVGTLGGWQWAFVVLVPGPLLGAAAMLVLRRLPEAARIAGGRR
jgi:MFS family permease